MVNTGELQQKIKERELKKQVKDVSDTSITRLKLTSYGNLEDGRLIDKKNELELYLNPENLTSSYSFAGSSKSETATKGTKKADGSIADTKNIESSRKISFSIVLDSTGAIPGSNDVEQDVQKLTDILVTYDGDIHSTPYVEVIWGSLYFVGQSEGLSVKYELFDSEAKPLRASTTLTFSELRDPKTNARIQNKQSPDLTHVRTLRAGDNLPLMCHSVYRNPGYYLQVARANKLSSFMDLRPGQRIVFPPLD